MVGQTSQMEHQQRLACLRVSFNNGVLVRFRVRLIATLIQFATPASVCYVKPFSCNCPGCLDGLCHRPHHISPTPLSPQSGRLGGGGLGGGGGKATLELPPAAAGGRKSFVPPNGAAERLPVTDSCRWSCHGR